MTRLVIHPGFHKTGTTSVQTMLRDNTDLLAAHLRVFLRDDFTTLAEAARRYSRKPNARHLDQVHDAARAFFAGLDPADPRPILMSSEDLSGHLPGRRGLTSYRAAAALMATLTRTARSCLGGGLDQTLYFSTRDPDGWLRSTYWQHLRVTRLDQTLEAYMRSMSRAADLEAALSRVADAVKNAAVTALPLSELRYLSQGPLTPLLELTGVPAEVRSQIAVAPPVNARPETGLEPVFLALNRSALSKQDLTEIKTRLLRMSRRTTDGD